MHLNFALIYFINATLVILAAEMSLGINLYKQFFFLKWLKIQEIHRTLFKITAYTELSSTHQPSGKLIQSQES